MSVSETVPFGMKKWFILAMYGSESVGYYYNSRNTQRIRSNLCLLFCLLLLTLY